MLEITDIERLARAVRLGWVGRRLVRIVDTDPEGFGRVLRNTAPEHLVWRLPGVLVVEVRRIGTSLITVLQNGPERQKWFVLQWRLGPSGWLQDLVGESPEPLFQRNRGPLRFTVQLDDGGIWGFRDQSLWSEMRLWSYAEVAQKRAGNLHAGGPDWISNRTEAADALFWHNPDSSRRVKDVLLDRSVTLAVGNGFALEACHAAKVHPHERWCRLSGVERSRLAGEVGGLIARSLRTATWSPSVYGREAGDWCLRRECLGAISVLRDRTDSAQRSYFCSVCQPLQEPQ